MAGTAGSIDIKGNGFAVMATGQVNLNAVASGTFVNTGLQVVLPSAGTFHLDSTVRASLGIDAAGENAFITARLFDVTAGAVVPDSEVIINQFQFNPDGANNSAPIQVEYTIPAARTVRLEATRVNAAGTANGASIVSDANGKTTLRFQRVS